MTFNSYQVSTAPEDISSYSEEHPSNSGVTVRLSQDGATDYLGVHSYDSTTSNNPESSHPFASATDKYGRFVSFNSLNEDTQVTLDGTTASLAQFEQLGYAKKDSEGKWDVVNTDLVKQGQAAQAEQEAIEHHNSLDLHPDALEHRFNQIIEPVPQEVYDSAISRFAETLDLDKLDVSGIAATSNQSDSEVKQHIDFIKDTFEGQVRATLGEDTDAVMKWAKANKEPDLKKAMGQLLTERSLEGVKGLQKSFQSDCSTEAQQHRAVIYLREQGISVNKKGDSWVVKTDTGETSLENCFKQGYVRWTGAKSK